MLDLLAPWVGLLGLIGFAGLAGLKQPVAKDRSGVGIRLLGLLGLAGLFGIWIPGVGAIGAAGVTRAAARAVGVHRDVTARGGTEAVGRARAVGIDGGAARRAR